MPRRAPYSSPKVFIGFTALTVLLSVTGGYLLAQLAARTNDLSLQRAEQFMAIEDNLDEAAIGLGQQIQEWKDMLLRANDEELYEKHRAAFIQASVGVQEALLRTQTGMLGAHMDISGIEQLRTEHKSLLSNYLHAYTKLHPRRKVAPSEVDKEIVGVDRSLQQHIAAVRSNIEHLARQQLDEARPAQLRRKMLIGMLGAAALLSMAWLGFAYARRFLSLRHETGAQRNLSSV